MVNGVRDGEPGVVLDMSSSGRVRLPSAGLDLVAVGLTSDEALGCAALLAAAEEVQDVAMPVDVEAGGWLAVVVGPRWSSAR